MQKNKVIRSKKMKDLFLSFVLIGLEKYLKVNLVYKNVQKKLISFTADKSIVLAKKFSTVTSKK